MRRNCYVALLCAFAILFFAGCENGAEAPVPTVFEKLPDRADEYRDVHSGHNKLFTLGFEPDSGLNPYVCDNQTNTAAFGLMYEGAFAVTADYGYEPVLALQWESGEKSFSFSLRPDVFFTDGSPVTAWDAAYSLKRAKESGSVYASRLSEVTAVDCDGERVLLSLKKNHSAFGVLLDVPIVKEGTAYSDVPVGTGPYVFTENGDEVYLAACEHHKDYDALPLKRIYLAQYTADKASAAFAEGMLDFAVSSTGETDGADYGDRAQYSRVDTTIMHYIGFSEKSDFFSAPERRRLLSGALDRAAAAKIIGGRMALLPISPVSEYYDASDAAAYNAGSFAQKCISALTEDYDDDGMLEYISDGEPKNFTLDFIVCNENAGRMRAAEKIARGLGDMGFEINVRALGYNEFMQALRNGSYDMYYASVRMTPDFDLTRLSGYGAGSEYGLRDAAVQQYINEFLAADGEEKNTAARALYAYVSETCTAAPLLFEQRAAVTDRDTVSGADPTWQNFFHGITSWHITLD